MERIKRHIAGRLRQRRRELDLTQAAVGRGCGVSFQQIAKYETGVSAPSAAQLFALAQALATPVTYFYEGLEAERTGQSPWSGLDHGLADGSYRQDRQFHMLPGERDADDRHLQADGQHQVMQRQPPARQDEP